MASVSSSNTFSVAAHSTNGMSGLVSGLDTDGMVEQMLSGTQAKIDKQEALKQQLTWKQEMYREIITNISGFSNKYLAYDATTNLSSTQFFDQMLANSTSSAFKVTGTSSASTGVTSMIVKQLAANAKAISTSRVSQGTLDGKMDLSALTNKRLVLEVQGSEVEVDLSGMTGSLTEENVVSYLNNELSGRGISVEINGNGALNFTGAPGKEIRVSGKSDAYALGMLGLGAYTSAAVKKDSDGNETARVLSGKLSLNPELKFQVALDGVSSYMNLKQDLVDAVIAAEAPGTSAVDKQAAWQALEDDLNHQLGATYGTLNNGADPMLKVKLDSTTGKIEFSTAGQDGHQVQIAGEDLTMSLLGITSNQSSRISTSVAMKNVNFKEELQGDEFKFKINDVEFTFNKNDSLYTVMKKINNGGAGVRVTYSALDDKFSIEATSAGSGDKIRIEQTQGNLLSAMFGSDNIEAGSSALSAVTGTDKVTVADDANGLFPAGFKSGTFSMRVNGEEVKFNFSAKSDDSAYSEDEIITQINRSLQQRFGYVEGSGSTARDREQAIEIKKGDNGKFAINVRNGVGVSFGASTGDDDLAAKMGFAGRNNAYSDADTSTLPNEIQDLLSAGVELQKDADGNLTGRFEAKGTIDFTAIVDSDRRAAAEAKFKELFGVTVDAATNQVSFDGDGSVKTGFVKEGNNAVVVINGVETERGSNNFTVNGLNFELKSASKVTYYNEDGTVNTSAAGVDSDGYLIDANGSRFESTSRIEGSAVFLNKDGLRISDQTILGMAAGIRSYVDPADATATPHDYLVDAHGNFLSDSSGNKIEGSVQFYNADGTENTTAEKVVMGSDGKTYLADVDGHILETVPEALKGRAEYQEDVITTERDTDSIVEGLKTFVEDYNKLVTELNKKLREDPSYKSYAPLTAAQKKEMTDREIEKWEEKSKEGLLRNDSDISMMLSAMRLALYQKPADAQYALYDFGIETVSGLADKKLQGTLAIDETKLREMLASDPEALRQLFTDTQGGLAAKLKAAADSAAKTSSGNPGTLVQKAGVSGYATDKNNTISSQITEIKDKLKQLNAQYEKERQRYWNQFNQMEQLIQQMNSQSNWLGNMFA